MHRHESRLLLRLMSRHPREVFKALSVEAMDVKTKRVKIKMDVQGEYLEMEMMASDTTALRAACNSFLRWYAAVESSLDVVSPLGTEAS